MVRILHNAGWCECILSQDLAVNKDGGIDPIGAIILSFLVDIIWLRTATKEFLLLIMVTAHIKSSNL